MVIGKLTVTNKSRKNNIDSSTLNFIPLIYKTFIDEIGVSVRLFVQDTPILLYSDNYLF